MGLLEWIVAGLIVGVLARLLLPGRHPIGCLWTVVLGVAGIYLGGRLWEEIFGRDDDIAWIGSVIVAMTLLWLFRGLSRGRYRY